VRMIASWFLVGQTAGSGCFLWKHAARARSAVGIDYEFISPNSARPMMPRNEPVTDAPKERNPSVKLGP